MQGCLSPGFFLTLELEWRSHRMYEIHVYGWIWCAFVYVCVYVYADVHVYMKAYMAIHVIGTCVHTCMCMCICILCIRVSAFVALYVSTCQVDIRTDIFFTEITERVVKV